MEKKYIDNGKILPGHLADCEGCGKTGVICDAPTGHILDRGFLRPIALCGYGILMMEKDVPVCCSCGDWGRR